MKLGCGSLQRKGRRWYLTIRCAGKLKWVALKTDNAGLAAERARKLLLFPGDTLSWMHHLVRIGKRAEASVKAGPDSEMCSWQNLHEHFASVSGDAPSAAACADHERYLRHLSSMTGTPPQTLSANEAREIAQRLSRQYLSAERMIRFYRRVWRTMNWDDTIWSGAGQIAKTANTACRRKEFYRRLTPDEVMRIIGHLRQAAIVDPVYGELADMVIIGYYTGLRLSDVAELEAGEIDNSGNYLKLVPNKTRRLKPRPLTIPIVREARAIVLSRRITANGGFLFSASARNRPTRKLSEGFRLAKIGKIDSGRASFHSLRATFISQMDEAGIPPHVTDAITGHGGGGMHARYTQPAAQALSEAVLRGIAPLFTPH